MGKADYRLYVVLDGGRRPSDPAAVARAAIEGGATVVQWSSSAPSTRAQIDVGRCLAEVTRSHGVPLVIGGRLDVMLAIGADGVLLGPDDMPAALARRLAGREAIIGVMAREPAVARAAAEEGADYVLYDGPVGAMASDVPIAVVASRLRHPDEAAAALQAGAQGVAVVAAHCRGGDVAAACRAFGEAIRQSAARTQQFAGGAHPIINEPPFGDGRPGFL